MCECVILKFFIRLGIHLEVTPMNGLFKMYQGLYLAYMTDFVVFRFGTGRNQNKRILLVGLMGKKEKLLMQYDGKNGKSNQCSVKWWNEYEESFKYIWRSMDYINEKSERNSCN